MTFLEIYDKKSQSETMKARVEVAISNAAIAVLNEDPATENNADRVIWASDALANTKGMTERMLWGVWGNSTIQTSGDASTDNDIQFVVNGLVNTYSG